MKMITYKHLTFPAWSFVGVLKWDNEYIKNGVWCGFDIYYGQFCESISFYGDDTDLDRSKTRVQRDHAVADLLKQVSETVDAERQDEVDRLQRAWIRKDVQTTGYRREGRGARHD